DAAAQGAIEVEDRDAALGDQVAAGASADLALAHVDGNGGLHGQQHQPVGLVVPFARLFHPAHAKVGALHGDAELDGIERVPALVGVHGDDEVRPAGLAGRPHAGEVFFEAGPADFHLDADAAGRAHHVDFFGNGVERILAVLGVVPADGDDRHAIAHAAQQFVHGRAVEFAAGVPHGVVQAADRLHHDAARMHVQLVQAAVAQIQVELEHGVPQALVVAHVLAHQQGGQVVPDDPHDVALGVEFVAAVGFADEAVVQVDAGDDGGAGADLVGAAL